MKSFKQHMIDRIEMLPEYVAYKQKVWDGIKDSKGEYYQRRMNFDLQMFGSPYRDLFESEFRSRMLNNR